MDGLGATFYQAGPWHPLRAGKGEGGREAVSEAAGSPGSQRGAPWGGGIHNIVWVEEKNERRWVGAERGRVHHVASLDRWRPRLSRQHQGASHWPLARCWGGAWKPDATLSLGLWKQMGLGLKELPPGCVTLGKGPSLSEPQFPSLREEEPRVCTGMCTASNLGRWRQVRGAGVAQRLAPECLAKGTVTTNKTL